MNRVCSELTVSEESFELSFVVLAKNMPVQEMYIVAVQTIQTRIECTLKSCAYDVDVIWTTPVDLFSYSHIFMRVIKSFKDDRC